MRKILVMVCSLMTLGGSIVWARTWVETQFTGFSIIMDRDTPGALLQLTIRTSTTTATGVGVRDISQARMPLARLTLATRNACRACYNEVFDTFSADESIPTPVPTSTP